MRGFVFQMYSSIKLIHLITIHLTIVLFVLKYLQNQSGSPFWRTSRLRHLPHLNDVILLISAVGLLHVTGWKIFVHFWITWKVACVVLYIVAGVLAMRVKQPRWLNRLFFIAAVLLYLTAYFFAVTKPL